MRLGRVTLSTIAAIHILLGFAVIQRVWDAARSEAEQIYVASGDAILCRSPSSLMLARENTQLPIAAMGCEVLDAGTLVTGTRESGDIWRMRMVNPAGRFPRGWGWRYDFTMPDGSQIIDGPFV